MAGWKRSREPACEEPEKGGLVRATFASLGRPAFRRYFVGHVLSLLGFWIRVIVQGWLVYELTGRRDTLGYVTAAGLLPLLVLSPFGGVLADRVDRRKLLMALPWVAITANVVLGILVLTERVQIGHVFAAAIFIGAARAVEIPVRNAFVSNLASRADLRNAIALNSAGFNVARVLGPALGAPLLWLLGVGPCFIIAAALNLIMVMALAGIRLESTDAGRVHAGPIKELLEGVRYVHGHRRTRTLMLLLAITLVFTWTYQTQMPAYAKDQLGMNESGYSLLMAAAGLGALVGALWVAGQVRGRRSNRYIVFGLVWAGTIVVFLLGLSSKAYTAVPLLVGAGFCQVGFMATANGLVQESVPDELRGRVMGIWAFVFGSFFPLGSLVMGTVAQRFSIAWAWCGGAILTVALSLVVLGRLPRRPPGGTPADPTETGRAMISDPTGWSAPPVGS